MAGYRIREIFQGRRVFWCLREDYRRRELDLAARQGRLPSGRFLSATLWAISAWADREGLTVPLGSLAEERTRGLWIGRPGQWFEADMWLEFSPVHVTFCGLVEDSA